MSELTQDMIKHAIDQDFNKANATFGEIMSVKMADVLDQQKIKLAGEIYNGENPDETDEEQLDLDLGDEEDVEGDGSSEDSEEGESEPDDQTEDESEEEEEIDDV